MNSLRHGWLALTLFSALASATGAAQAAPWGRGLGGPSAFAQPTVAAHGAWGGGGGGGGGGFGHHGGYGGHGGGYRHGGGHGGWVGPLLGAALLGGAIYATLPPAPVVVQPPPVVYSQPPVITDPSRVRYYCQPYQQYYPNVNQCPSAWQIVPY